VSPDISLFDQTGSATRPAGVKAVAVVFSLCAAYLAGLGLLMLLRPGAISMALGAPLLGGLELAGPYMFLLVAAVGGLIAYGLLQLNNWARRAAIAAAMVGVVMLVPDVSSAVVEFRLGKLVWGGLGVMIRVVIVWYLYQTPVAEQFLK
jgi:hypothetical protein